MAAARTRKLRPRRIATGTSTAGDPALIITIGVGRGGMRTTTGSDDGSSASAANDVPGGNDPCPESHRPGRATPDTMDGAVPASEAAMWTLRDLAVS